MDRRPLTYLGSPCPKVLGIFTIFLEVGYQSPPIRRYFWRGWVPGPPKGPHFDVILVHPRDPELAEIGTQPLPALSGGLRERVNNWNDRVYRLLYCCKLSYCTAAIITL